VDTDSTGHGATTRAQRREVFGDIRLAAMKPGCSARLPGTWSDSAAPPRSNACRQRRARAIGDRRPAARVDRSAHAPTFRHPSASGPRSTLSRY